MRDGWIESTLGEIALSEKGKKPRLLSDDPSTGLPYLTADVLRGEACEKFVPSECLEGCITLDGSETIILWDGAGAGDVFPSEIGVLASTMAKLTSGDITTLHNEFLRLAVERAIPDIKATCRGTTVPHVSPQALSNLKLRLPTISGQVRIVDLVSSVDEYIAALQRQADAARTARNAVLHELLTTGGGDWVETTIGNVASINPEAVSGLSRDDEIIYVDLASVSAESGISDDLYRGTFGEAPGRARRVIRAEDVLVSTVRPYLRGFAQVPVSLDGQIASTGFAVLRANPNAILPGFIWAIVGSNRFVDFLMDRATGSSYPAVRPDDVASFRLSLPSLEVQRQIVGIVSSLDDVIRATESATVKAKSLRSGLLSELLSGEHEIPDSYDRLLGAA